MLQIPPDLGLLILPLSQPLLEQKLMKYGKGAVISCERGGHVLILNYFAPARRLRRKFVFSQTSET